MEHHQYSNLLRESFNQKYNSVESNNELSEDDNKTRSKLMIYYKKLEKIIKEEYGENNLNKLEKYIRKNENVVFKNMKKGDDTKKLAKIFVNNISGVIKKYEEKNVDIGQNLFSGVVFYFVLKIILSLMFPYQFVPYIIGGVVLGMFVAVAIIIIESYRLNKKQLKSVNSIMYNIRKSVV